jgi:hypothetical protein
MNLSPRPHVRSIIDADGAVLLDLREGRYYSLNAVGGRIWTRLATGWSLSQIERDLSEAFAVPIQIASRDVSAFIADLKGKCLLDGSDQ